VDSPAELISKGIWLVKRHTTGSVAQLDQLFGHQPAILAPELQGDLALVAGKA